MPSRPSGSYSFGQLHRWCLPSGCAGVPPTQGALFEPVAQAAAPLARPACVPSPFLECLASLRQRLELAPCQRCSSRVGSASRGTAHLLGAGACPKRPAGLVVRPPNKNCRLVFAPGGLGGSLADPLPSLEPTALGPPGAGLAWAALLTPGGGADTASTSTHFLRPGCLHACAQLRPCWAGVHRGASGLWHAAVRQEHVSQVLVCGQALRANAA